MTSSDARVFPLTVMVLVCVTLFFTSGLARAAAKHPKDRQLTVCQDTEFALCAASTCTATGGSIKDNQGTKHKAVSCECPIIVGDNIADLNGGNMQGSCTSSNPDIVYSTFEFSDSFPQLIDGTWQDATSIMQVCPSQDSFSQCWNWQCTRGGTENGVELAECTCPMEKTEDSFVTQAGQGDSSACAELPVGGPLFFDPDSTHTGGH
jgi:hypothetical protein